MGKIVIIGAGMMGSALSIPARDNGHEVALVGTHLDTEIIEHARKTGTHLTMRRPLPEGIAFHQLDTLADALKGADLILCGVSSFGVDWFAEQIVPQLSRDIPILSVTKGLLNMEDGTLRTFPDILKERCPGYSFNAIGGPCTSYELADRRHSAVAFCGEDVDTLRRIRDLLETEYYHISISKDIMGVECAVALKNAYALAVSLAIGMAETVEGEGGTLHYNPQAALFGQSVREMSRLLALLGGKPENIVYGAGDLYVTIFGGRTRLLGTLLGRGLSFDDAIAKLKGVTLESVVIARRTIAAMEARAAAGTIDKGAFPLLFHIGALLDGKTGAKIPWTAFEAEEI